MVAGVFLPLRLSSGAPDSFRGVVRAVTVDGVHVSDLHGGQHVVERTPQHAARDGLASFKVSLMLTGTGLLVQDGRETVLRPGDLAVYDTQRPYTLEFDRGFRSLVVMFPQNRIELPAGLVGQLTAVRLGGDRSTEDLDDAPPGHHAHARLASDDAHARRPPARSPHGRRDLDGAPCSPPRACSMRTCACRSCSRSAEEPAGHLSRPGRRPGAVQRGRPRSRGTLNREFCTHRRSSRRAHTA